MNSKRTIRCAYCEKHNLAYEEQVLELFNSEFKSKCPECEREEEQRQERERRARRVSAKDSNIEPEYQDASLENFCAETPSQDAALSAVLGMMETQEGFVLLAGASGVGKTHLACAAARRLGGAVYTMQEIALTLRATFSPKSTRTEQEELARLASVAFLAIDELARGRKNEQEAQWLFYIIDKRSSRRLPTMLISARPLSRTLAGAEKHKSFEAWIGEALASRIKACGVGVQMEGRNRRLP